MYICVCVDSVCVCVCVYIVSIDYIITFLCINFIATAFGNEFVLNHTTKESKI